MTKTCATRVEKVSFAMGIFLFSLCYQCGTKTTPAKLAVRKHRELSFTVARRNMPKTQMFFLAEEKDSSARICCSSKKKVVAQKREIDGIDDSRSKKQAKKLNKTKKKARKEASEVDEQREKGEE